MRHGHPRHCPVWGKQDRVPTGKGAKMEAPLRQMGMENLSTGTEGSSCLKEQSWPRLLT